MSKACQRSRPPRDHRNTDSVVGIGAILPRRRRLHVSQRHDRLALLDRYLRIPTISRQVTPAMVEDVRAFWREVGLDLALMPVPDGSGTPALWVEIPGPT